MNCVLCNKKNEDDKCVYGILSTRDNFSLSGNCIDKAFICLSCLVKSEKENETIKLFASRVKGIVSEIEFVIVGFFTQDGKYHTQIKKAIKNEDLKEYKKVVSRGFTTKEQAEKSRP